MATESATKFLESIWKDEQLRERVQVQKDFGSVIAIASESGYHFDENEFHEAQIEFLGREGVELDEEALDTVAGGTCCCCCCKDEEIQQN